MEALNDTILLVQYVPLKSTQMLQFDCSGTVLNVLRAATAITYWKLSLVQVQ